MDRYQGKKEIGQKGRIYFNFNKFEKLLDKLQIDGINLAVDDFEVKRLKAYKDFNYFFEKFSNQEIKSHLLFYQQQLKDQEDS